MNEQLISNVTGNILASDYIPFLKFFFKKRIEKLRSIFRDFTAILKEKYISHQNDYQQGIIRDFTDALISAKIDALENEKESAPYLTDDNLALTLFDLFIGYNNHINFSSLLIIIYL